MMAVLLVQGCSLAPHRQSHEVTIGVRLSLLVTWLSRLSVINAQLTPGKLDKPAIFDGESDDIFISHDKDKMDETGRRDDLRAN